MFFHFFAIGSSCLLESGAVWCSSLQKKTPCFFNLAVFLIWPCADELVCASLGRLHQDSSEAALHVQPDEDALKDRNLLKETQNVKKCGLCFAALQDRRGGVWRPSESSAIRHRPKERTERASESLQNRWLLQLYKITRETWQRQLKHGFYPQTILTEKGLLNLSFIYLILGLKITIILMINQIKNDHSFNLTIYALFMQY